MWLNDTNIVTFGRTESYENPRLSVEGDGDAYNMVIKNVGLMDEGNWECQVPGRSTLRQVNTLTIVSK